MSQYAYDLNPVQRIVADAIGEPGNRTFFIQGRAGSSLVTVVLEKQEVANLAVSVLQLLEELEQKYPNLKPVAASGSLLVPESPVEPLFRVAQLIVGYDEADDMIWLIARARTAGARAGELGAQVVEDEELEELEELPEIDYFALDESADIDDDDDDDDDDDVTMPRRPRCALWLRVPKCARSVSMPWRSWRAGGPPARCAAILSNAPAISARAPTGRPCRSFSSAA